MDVDSKDFEQQQLDLAASLAQLASAISFHGISDNFEFTQARGLLHTAQETRKALLNTGGLDGSLLDDAETAVLDSLEALEYVLETELVRYSRSSTS